MIIRGFESELVYIGNLMSVKAQMRFYRAVMKKNGQRSMLVRLETHYMNLVN